MNDEGQTFDALGLKRGILTFLERAGYTAPNSVIEDLIVHVQPLDPDKADYCGVTVAVMALLRSFGLRADLARVDSLLLAVLLEEPESVNASPRAPRLRL